MNPTFSVKLVRLKEPIGPVTHALIKCPRCLRGIGITGAMLAGIDSIICRGALGFTGAECGGHYYFNATTCTLMFIGTVNHKPEVKGKKCNRTQNL